jgi:choline dehydrogenase-like flavoprotein
MTERRTDCDVLIVGSGPVGATFARVIADQVPGAKILMVDAGPALTDPPGIHTKNISDPNDQARAQIRSQGPTQFQYDQPSIQERASAATASGPNRISLLGRPGTHLLTPEPPEHDGMPAAAMSTNVGGMGVHWTCAVPRPGNTERIPFIASHEWDRVVSRAEALLQATQHAFPSSSTGAMIERILGETFNANLPKDRWVQPMPLACQVLPDGTRSWSGPRAILGSLEQTHSGFELRSETICKRLLHHKNQVTGAELEHLPSNTHQTVTAQVVVVAADALRTPQLLWASGIRPAALGHYLNDQPQVIGATKLEAPPVTRAPGDPVVGVTWVPFHDPSHPFHGQVMQMDLSPIQLEAGSSSQQIVGFGWFCRKDLRFEDRLGFSDTLTDHFGMPSITIHYGLSPTDEQTIAQAKLEVQRGIDALGPSLGPVLRMPAGSSLHYQGTTRMGEHDDGQSVCDSYSSVWGWKNLFVGGNGVIPTSTACNPTLTSVALAVRACEQIVEMLNAR